LLGRRRRYDRYDEHIRNCFRTVLTVRFKTFRSLLAPAPPGNPLAMSLPKSPTVDRESPLSNLSGVGKILKRRWLVLFVSLLLGAAGGAAYFFGTAVKYESSAQILIMRKDPRMATQAAESSDQTAASVSEDLLSTHIQILQSPEIVGSALKSGKFDELPSIVGDLDPDETPVDYVIRRLTVTRGGTGQSRLAHVLNIGMRHTSEQETKAIVDAIIGSYRTFLSAKFQDVSQEAATLITQAKVELAAELKTAEENYRKFREEADLLFSENETSNIHRVRFEELQKAISETRLKASTAAARLEVVEQAITELNQRNASDVERLALLDQQDVERVTMLINVDKGDANTAEFQSNQPMRLEMARARHESFMKLMLDEQSLAADLGDDHPRLQEVRNQIKAAKTFFATQSEELGEVEKKPRLTAAMIVDAYCRLLKQDLTTLKKHQGVLEKMASDEESSARELVADELKNRAMLAEIERVKLLSDAVLERLREINLVKDYGGFVTEVIAPAKIGNRVAPKLSLSILSGLLVGLVLGCGAAAASEFRDQAFHNLEALRGVVEPPILATIPPLPKELDPADLAAGREPGRSPQLVAYYRPKSREAEVFRGLRTQVLFAARDGDKRLIACSSPTTGDGKSTVLANLAVSIALSGKRVLLVDCDLRRPTVRKVFNLGGGPGLSDLVDGRAEPPEVIQQTDVENLSIVACGEIPSNPAELLSSRTFEEFLAARREDFDFILLDCPPILAVSDPCVIIPKADMLVLVFNLRNNTRPHVLRTQEMLRQIGAPPIAVVVNGVEAQQRTGYDGYSYGYDYGSKTNGTGAYYDTPPERSDLASPPKRMRTSSNGHAATRNGTT
jgi:capsular exopolysaccharide synthesis family protein